jgi:uncharacterized RDD family membrane protein YckC
MFTIIGSDGKEYGPVTAQQVRAWIQAGRADLDTQAKALGTNEWKKLDEFPEFSGVDKPPSASAGLAAGRSLAGRGTRLGSFLIDAFLSFLCLVPLMSAMVAAASTQSIDSFSFTDVINLAGKRNLLGTGALLLIVTVVQVVMLSTLGQSIGKRLLRIRIVRFRDDRNPGFVHAFLLRRLLPACIGMIPVLGMFFTLADVCLIFREDRRCLHDFMADTVVVDASRAPLP